MSSPFPLLRLPGVVLYEVFKSLSIGEKIKLSLCSTKISTQIKDARLYSQKVIVYLDMSYQRIRVYSEKNYILFEISIHPDSGKSHNSNTQQCSIACCTVRIVPVPNGIKIFWKNQQEGYLSVIQHLLKIFQCKVSTKSSCYDSDIFHSTISKLFDLQLKFKRLTIRLNGSKLNNLLFNQISNKFGLVEDLSISSVHDPGFIPVVTSWPQKIDITSSAWFTLESLLGCTCTRISLWGSDLDNKDLDEVLRNWKTGGFPNLEYLYLSSRNITNNGTNILGINLRELDGMVIQADDASKKATIKTNDQNIEMSVTLF